MWYFITLLGSSRCGWKIAHIIQKLVSSRSMLQLKLFIKFSKHYQNLVWMCQITWNPYWPILYVRFIKTGSILVSLGYKILCEINSSISISQMLTPLGLKVQDFYTLHLWVVNSFKTDDISFLHNFIANLLLLLN